MCYIRYSIGNIEKWLSDHMFFCFVFWLKYGLGCWNPIRHAIVLITFISCRLRIYLGVLSSNLIEIWFRMFKSCQTCTLCSYIYILSVENLFGQLVLSYSVLSFLIPTMFLFNNVSITYNLSGCDKSQIGLWSIGSKSWGHGSFCKGKTPGMVYLTTNFETFGASYNSSRSIMINNARSPSTPS